MAKGLCRNFAPATRTAVLLDLLFSGSSNCFNKDEIIKNLIDCFSSNNISANFELRDCLRGFIIKRTCYENNDLEFSCFVSTLNKFQNNVLNYARSVPSEILKYTTICLNDIFLVTLEAIVSICVHLDQTNGVRNMSALSKRFIINYERLGLLCILLRNGIEQLQEILLGDCLNQVRVINSNQRTEGNDTEKLLQVTNQTLLKSIGES